MAKRNKREKKKEGKMSIYKRGSQGIYWYRFQFNGRTIRESTKQTNDKVARRQESMHRARLSNGEVGIREKKQAPTLKAFCTERIEPYARALSPTKWTWYRAGIRALVKYATLANMPLDEIRSEHAAGFAAWRTAQEITPGAINSNLRVLRRILRLAADWGVVEIAPKIQLLTGEARRERVISPDEETRYLAKCSPFLSEVFIVLIDTGVRPDELHRMQWQEISWPHAGKRGTVLVIKGKSLAARRLIPMTPRVYSTLAERWEAQGKPAHGWVWPAPTQTGHMSHDTTKKQHRKALKDSRVPAFVLYSARHSFLTRLGASGCDVWTLMQYRTLLVTMACGTYIHADTIDRAAAGRNSQVGQKWAHGNHRSAKEGRDRRSAIPAILGGERGRTRASADHLKGHCSTN